MHPLAKNLLCTALLLLPALAPAQTPAQDPTPVVTVPNPPNTPAPPGQPYVVLVSLDGFRYDYPKKYGAPHLAALAAAGASAPDGMLPSYPSLTFPNHLSLITGLYPEHHGIVANTFYDPARDATYIYRQSKFNGDGTWYTGTPLWSLAEQQGMRAACLFWPGSEAEIAGKRPSYYLKFDDKLDDTKRIDQVVAWLQLPPGQRPHLITLYFSNVDHAGHTYGPDSEEVRAAVHYLDDEIGSLQTRLAALHLPIDLVVVADHGMAPLTPEVVDLSQFANLANFHTEGSLLYPKTDADAAKAYEEFKAHPDPRFTVYRRADLPPALHFNENPRAGDPIVVANGPYSLRAHVTPEQRTNTERGEHGFDPRAMPEMKAIFYAAGPDIRPGVTLPPFENVNVYPFLADLLGLTPPPIDGKVRFLTPALAQPLPVQLEHMGGFQTQPKVIHTASPEYTPQARAAKVAGNVLINFIVEADGSVSHLRVMRGLGYGLDEKALEAVRQYRFKPAIKNGQPIATPINIEVNFSIF